MDYSAIRNLAICVWSVLALALTTVAANSEPGNVEQGEVVYIKRCLQCHGDEGDGLGPAAEFLNPPPRDFTLGLFKFKTTAFDEDLPNDEDLLRMIRDGMPGTAMPGWSDMLSEQDMIDVVAYIKTFAELEGEPEIQLDYGTQVATSDESIAAGKVLFEEGDRCTECHGLEGKGNAIKKLKNDNGERTWPRNLTKPWTFRAGNDPKEIFARISAGIPTTQMPSFSDPKSTKKLSIEERWHVANYVTSLAKVENVVNAENFVIQAARHASGLPTSPDDEAWKDAPSSTFFMVPQIVGKKRFFLTANDTISARALYDDKQIAIYLEWDDRTKSIPGDTKAASIADENLSEDAVAIQFPRTIPNGMEKPYFLMGDGTNPVNLWRWSSGTTEQPETGTIIDARGIGDLQSRDDSSDLSIASSYRNGTWRVVMTRSLATGAPENDLQFEEGRFVPIAFFAWDGSNSEAGTAHAMTTWYWLQMKPAADSKPWIYAIIAALLVGAMLFWWARGAQSRNKENA